MQVFSSAVIFFAGIFVLAVIFFAGIFVLAVIFLQGFFSQNFCLAGIFLQGFLPQEFYFLVQVFCMSVLKSVKLKKKKIRKIMTNKLKSYLKFQ